MSKKVLLIALVIFLSFWNVVCRKEIETKELSSNFINFLSSHKLPDELEFCGERVPLDNFVIRERAEREFYVNLQQPGQLILYLKRTTRFFPIFDSVFRKYSIPDDFKYLAISESGLQNIRSPKDALGVWQFIPSTAKEYGLIVNDTIDERLNIYKSTEAACRYLRRAYEKFGSWVLAAASYNMGVAGLEDNINFQEVKNYFELYLNEETSRYIFRIVILKEILTNWEKYGFALNPLDFYPPIKTKQIIWSEGIPNLVDWAKKQNTNYFMVKFLNPWILRRSLPKPNSFYVIDIPVE
ncbi:MAG: lytic transglycosylase domain-containing protein [Candidatus Kapaibacteriales bacterium]